jgi:hypothetical protein
VVVEGAGVCVAVGAGTEFSTGDSLTGLVTTGLGLAGTGLSTGFTGSGFRKVGVGGGGLGGVTLGLDAGIAIIDTSITSGLASVMGSSSLNCCHIINQTCSNNTNIKKSINISLGRSSPNRAAQKPERGAVVKLLVNCFAPESRTRLEPMSGIAAD